MAAVPPVQASDGAPAAPSDPHSEAHDLAVPDTGWTTILTDPADDLDHGATGWTRLPDAADPALGRAPDAGATDLREVRVAEMDDRLFLRIRLAALPPEGDACQVRGCMFRYSLVLDVDGAAEWDHRPAFSVWTRCLGGECGDMRLLCRGDFLLCWSAPAIMTLRREPPDTFLVVLHKRALHDPNDMPFQEMPATPARLCVGDRVGVASTWIVTADAHGSVYRWDPDRDASFPANHAVRGASPDCPRPPAPPDPAPVETAAQPSAGHLVPPTVLAAAALLSAGAGSAATAGLMAKRGERRRDRRGDGQRDRRDQGSDGRGDRRRSR